MSQARFLVGLPLALLAAVLGAACAPRPVTTPHLPGVEPAAAIAVRVRVGEGAGARIEILPLEEYVAGSVQAELELASLEPQAAERVAEVQALVARTYAIANRGRHATEGFDLCSTTHCQLFRPPHLQPANAQPIARAAAAATRGLVVLDGHGPIEALFHANCAGHTSAVADVWGRRALAYLRAVPDPFCPGRSQPPWRFEATATRLVEALNHDSRTRVGAFLRRIDVIERDIATRAVRVILDGERTPIVLGEELRTILLRSFGPESVRSTRFSVSRQGDLFVFEGRGNGHGVGLCQAGALARVRAGHSLQAILETYFPGTVVGQIPRLTMLEAEPNRRRGSLLR